MLLSFALIFLGGTALAAVVEKLHLPRLLGMLLAGIVLGPYVLGWIDGTVLEISAQIRQIALTIIMLRAGLALNLHDLRKVGRPAAMMCCVPALFEIGGFVLLGMWLLQISPLDAAVIGCILAAVSPAVLVPKMLRLMEEGYGTAKGIPQMLLAGASVDDVFVIVLFTGFANLAQTGEFSALALLQIPISILLGVTVGSGSGFVLAKLFARFVRTPAVQMMVLLSVAFLFTEIENRLKGTAISFAAMLAVISMGVCVLRFAQPVAKALQPKFSGMWSFAEIFLFVLVGAMINLSYAAAVGPWCVVVILGAMVFRAVGVLLCIIKTALNWWERLFCVIAYVPKATVQAAIGGVPLAMGLACGDLAATVAVLAILITAPLGALGIEWSYKKLLSR